MPHSTSQHRFLQQTMRWLVVAGLSFGSATLSAAELAPFTASYAADMKKIPVNGEAIHTLEQNADGTWNLSFSAGMFVARLSENSTLRLEEDRVVPLSYHYERKGLGRSRETSQVFDWENQLVKGEHKGETFTLATEPGLLDKTTYQLALQRDLMAGRTEMIYRVVDGDEIDEYEFRVVGDDRVTTRAGQFDAVEVERIRDADSKRQTTLWFAKDWNYLLVRLSQVETDGQHYRIMLKEATLDGKPVVGTPVAE
ncbi:dehydrogenase [Halopseudomonas salina]|uniref:Dehydrogenase n=2 Tax=Halopseudomonas salina TaxID=1323744 RepID=A0ABQ1NZP1_9GAMM|nr:dehydrogenase [Halopseudomonas salina]